MRYLSLFSGIGGFELGIRRALPTAECVGFSEIDKYAISVYQYNFKGHTNYGDANTIITDRLPRYDTIVGGFPCQAFSHAGKRQGFDDTRGTLFYQIARLCADQRPRHLVLENVKGLLTHDHGKTWQTILRVFAELGYTVEWMVLNSKRYVPQSRERVYIIGHLTEQCTNQVLPLKDYAGVSSKPRAHKKDQPYLVHNIYGGFNESKPRVYKDTAPTIRTAAGGGHLPSVVEPVIAAQRKRAGGQTLEPRADRIANSLTTAKKDNYLLEPIDDGFKVREATKTGYAVARPGDVIHTAQPSSKTRRGRVGKQASHTIDTAGGKRQLAVMPDFRLRRLTPIECERLQGFPDDWTKYGVAMDKYPIEHNVEISDTQRYKMCGNAVTVDVVAAVFEGLRDAGCVE